MKPSDVCRCVIPLALLLTASSSPAEVVAFIDESAYLSAISSYGYGVTQEGFENDSPWGAVRSTIVGGPQTSPLVTNLGISWMANNTISEVTTSSGAARTGQWGLYTLPHGNPPTIGDGFTGNANTTLYGIGGWIRTNTPPAGISLWLDIGLPNETEVDFDGNDVLNAGAHSFFGVINTDGFTRFDYLETEFDVDEQKFVFADDFTFATAVPEPNQIAGLLIAGTVVCCRRRLKIRRNHAVNGSRR